MLIRPPIVRGATDETRIPSSTRAINRKTLLAQPRRVEGYTRVSGMAGTGVPRGRGGIEWCRMVASQFFEVDGCLDGAGRIRFKWLPTTGSPPGSIYEECGVDNSRKISVLRNRDASAHRRDSAYRNDCGRTPDQTRRQSIASGKWWRDRHFRSGVDSRSLRSIARATIRSQREKERSRSI